MKRILLILLAALMTTCALAEEMVPTVEATEAPYRELAQYFGQDIAQAAEAVGGLTFEAGEEFSESYFSDHLALRGNGGVVTFIDLGPTDTEDQLLGVHNGMARSELQTILKDYTLLWDYPEELAWTIRADEADELKNEILVVFFDESGVVAGAWYRISG